MTNDEIVSTCDAMRCAPEHREAIKSRALAGDEAARFAVFGARRSNSDRRAAVNAWLERSRIRAEWGT